MAGTTNPFEITPSVVVNVEYDDNLYFTAENIEDDLITKVTPTINLKLSRQTTENLILFYKAQVSLYEEHINLNEVNQSVNLTYNHIFSKQLAWDIHNCFSQSRALDEDISNKDKRAIMQIMPSLTLRPTPKIYTRLGYKYEDIDFERRDIVDSEGEFYSARLNYAILPRVSIYTTGCYSKRAYEGYTHEDIEYNQYGVGILYRPRTYISVETKYGIEKVFLFDKREFNDPVFNIELSGNFPKNTTININFLEETSLGRSEVTSLKVQKMGINLHRSLTKKTSFDLGWLYKEEVYQSTEESSLWQQINLGLSYTLGKSISVDGRYNYSWHENSAVVMNNIYSMGVTIKP